MKYDSRIKKSTPKNREPADVRPFSWVSGIRSVAAIYRNDPPAMVGSRPIVDSDSLPIKVNEMSAPTGTVKDYAELLAHYVFFLSLFFESFFSPFSLLFSLPNLLRPWASSRSFLFTR
jgi:hypothetical protein